MLQVTHLHKKYRSKEAVRDVTFSISEGEFVGLIGPNGAGKSTTIKMIAGLIEPTSGDISLRGLNLFSNPEAGYKHLGYVAQSPKLFANLTGREYLEFVAKARRLNDYTSQIDELLEITTLTDAANKLIKDYSGGMAQKIAICGALLGHPDLLLLDESFVGLDPESTYAIEQKLKDHAASGGSVLLSSHILSMLQGLCSRFIFLFNGQVVADCSREEFEKMCQNGDYETLVDYYLDLRAANSPAA